VGVEVLVCFELRDCSYDYLVDILELVAFCFWAQEDSSLREAFHCLEGDIEGREVLETGLESIKGGLEEWSIDEGEAEVDVRLPAFEGGIVEFPQGLNLLVVCFYCECQGGVID
jgi:hypothetical protein